MRVRVCGLVLNDSKLLFLKYGYERGDVFAIPGGGVNSGETCAQAVGREFREELGLEVEVGSLRFVADMGAMGSIGQTLHLVFLTTLVSGEPRLDPEQTKAQSVEWVPFHDLMGLSLYPDIKTSLLTQPFEELFQRQAENPYLGASMERQWF